MTTLLLAGRHLPTTGVIGFLDVPIPAIVDAIADVIAPRMGIPASEIVRTEVTGPLSQALDRQLPRVEPPTGDAFLLVPTEGTWTALFDNGRIGSDPGDIAAVLPDRIGCRSVVVWATGEQVGGPTLGFRLAAPGHAGRLHAVRVHLVTGTGPDAELQTYGDPLPVEADDDPRELTLDRLDHYLSWLDIHAFDADWYFPPGATGLLLSR